MEKLNQTFSQNLNYYMDLRRVNRSDLARAVGVATSTASDWCLGRKVPRADKVAAICDFLKISMNDLLVDKPSALGWEQQLLQEHKVLLRQLYELSEEDRQIIENMVARLRGGEKIE